MKKILSILLVVFCTTMLLTSCEDRNAVKLVSLSGTKWKYEWDDKNYQTYHFKSDGSCTYLIRVESEGENTLPLNWTCTSSGYVKTTVKVTNQLWKTGWFDGERGYLEMDGYIFKLVNH